MAKWIQAQERRKLAILAGLAVLFTAMQVTGYQISMYYHTTVHRSAFFQRIGMLSVGQCAAAFILGLAFWGGVLSLLFLLLDKAEGHAGGGNSLSDV